jgi:hypothetical protein
MLQIGFRSFKTDKDSNAFTAFGVYETIPPKGQLADFVLPILLSFRQGTPLTLMLEGLPYSPKQLTASVDGAVFTPREGMTFADILKFSAGRPTTPTRSNAELVCWPTQLEPSVNRSVVYAFMGFCFFPRDVYVETSSVYVFKCLPRELGFNQTCLFLEGALGEEFRPELGEIDLDEIAKDATYEQLMRQPWWGFSSFPLSLAQQCSAEVQDDLPLLHGLSNDDARQSRTLTS